MQAKSWSEADLECGGTYTKPISYHSTDDLLFIAGNDTARPDLTNRSNVAVTADSLDYAWTLKKRQLIADVLALDEDCQNSVLHKRIQLLLFRHEGVWMALWYDNLWYQMLFDLIEYRKPMSPSFDLVCYCIMLPESEYFKNGQNDPWSRLLIRTHQWSKHGPFEGDSRQRHIKHMQSRPDAAGYKMIQTISIFTSTCR